MRRRFVSLVTAILALAVASARAEEPELRTDRPGFTQTSVTVPSRRLQVEGGVTYTSLLGADELSGPELLLRYGLMSRVELRLGAPDVVRTRLGDLTEVALSEATVGLKIQLTPSTAALGVSLIPVLTIPTDPDATGENAPALVATWTRALTSEWSVGGNVGHGWYADADRGPDATIATVSVGRPVGDRVGTFFEWTGEFPEDEESIHMLHHGYTYASAPLVQFDVHVAAGITEASPDFFIGMGFAFRR